MTIAVAVRTSSAVVFATDSKLTSRGLAGKNADGSLNWVSQTYDNATKVVHDRTGRLMALAAGTVNVGATTATDFIASRAFDPGLSSDSEQIAIDHLLEDMEVLKTEFWSKTQAPPEEWPGPTMMLAIPSPSCGPRVWRADLNGSGVQISETLEEPGIRFEGSYGDVFGLLFGMNLDVLGEIGKEIGVETPKVLEGLGKIVRPIDRINLKVMPLQDAIDLAVFLATVQIEMDRFLPGVPACGGPIDVMVLQMVPTPQIVAYPGKTLHHPHRSR